MKAGFIAVVGRPNVGKSTLINKLVSEKVAIVSDKAGTTRDNIKGILNFKDNQYIFIDTPGIHKPQHLLGEYMTNIAVKILKDVDIILFLIDASKPIGTGDMFVMDRINENSKKPRILFVIFFFIKNLHSLFDFIFLQHNPFLLKMVFSFSSHL